MKPQAYSHPYWFLGTAGHAVDWSAYLGEVAPLVSGHDRPISPEELAIICGRKARECNLYRAIKACQSAGETDQAIALCRQMLGEVFREVKRREVKP